MPPYKCEKHGVHYGQCAVCLQEQRAVEKEIIEKRRRDEIKALRAENAKLKEENDHLDNVIQGLHHDLDVLREI